MGSPLSGTIAEIFLQQLKNKIQQKARHRTTKQQDNDYLQLHNNRTTLLLTNLQPK